MTEIGGVNIGRGKDGGGQEAYIDRFWESADGLHLHYRDYEGPEGSTALPVVCIPGPTRNARDFEALAPQLSAQRRVIAVDLRGRGLSEQSRDSATYVPAQYADDIARLLDQAEIAQAVFVGTSLGGIVTMLVARGDPARVAGAILNDIGPVVEPEGLERIRDYVGYGRSFPTWMHAARALQEAQGDCYRDWRLEQWLVHAKRLMVMGSNGRIGYDYDLRIVDEFIGADEGGAAGPAQLWEAYDALAGRPVLVLRGACSDILSERTAHEMAARNPEAELVTVPRTGHAPTLDEEPVRVAIARLLNRTG